MAKKSVSQYERMTQAPVGPLIVFLAIPSIISMMVTSINNLIDTVFVGFLGTSASGAIGIVFGYLAILQAIGFTFGQGTGSLISRQLGNKEVDKAIQYVSTGVFWSFAISTVISILSAVFINKVIFFLGSTATIAPYARVYILWILTTAPFLVAGFSINSILRFEGQAFYGMIGLVAGCILHLGGNFLFVLVFDMGIAGVGLATTIANFIAFIILLIPFYTSKMQTTIKISKITLSGKVFMEIVTTGLPSLLRQGLTSIATVLLNFEAAFYGDAAVAAMSIVSRLFFLAFAIGLGVGQGFQPVCGFNFGARKFKRVRDGFRLTIIISQIVLLVLAAILFIWAPQFVEWMRNDPEVVVIGARALRLQCVAMMFMPISVTTETMLQVCGERLGASVLSSLRNGVIFIPVLVLMELWRGLAGVEEAQAIAFVLSIIPSIIYLVRFFRKIPKGDEA